MSSVRFGRMIAGRRREPQKVVTGNIPVLMAGKWPYIVKKGVKVGIPQGPLLFSLYVNDIDKACGLPSTLLFADDTALVFTGDISDEAINGSLDRIFRWFCVNKLTLNCEKTKFTVLSNKMEESVVKPNLTIYGRQLEQDSIWVC